MRSGMLPSAIISKSLAYFDIIRFYNNNQEITFKKTFVFSARFPRMMQLTDRDEVFRRECNTTYMHIR